MSLVSIFLLTIAAIFLVGIVGELVFAKTGLPDVVWLIGMGVILGPVTQLVTRESLMNVAPYFGALTLVIVLFDGGSELKLKELSQAAGRGTMLAVVGFVLAVLAVAPVAMFASDIGILPSNWTWTHAIMLGTILGGSSSVVIMPALSKAGLSAKISNLVNLESALTDVLSVVAAGAVIQILATHDGSAGGGAAAAATLGKSFGIGLVCGGLGGLLTVLTLQRLKSSEYAYTLILGFFLVLYVVIDELGGSAALGILVAAIMAGNAPLLSKSIGLAKVARLGRNVKGVHGVITFMIKSFFFVFIGAMLGPPWDMLLLGVVLGVVLLLARLPNVLFGTMKSGLSTPARGLVSILFPRGMAAGVLAMMPYQAGIEGTEELPVVVFSGVVTTIFLFAIGFPILKKRLPKEDLAGGDPAGSSMYGELLGSFAESPAAITRALSPDHALGEADTIVATGSASTETRRLGVVLPGGPADATTVDSGTADSGTADSGTADPSEPES